MTRKVFWVLIIITSLTCIFAEDVKYLIITHDNFYNTIQPLAEWKNKKGVPTKVVKLSEIGSDANSIRNYIRNTYNASETKPEYVLLVGDINYITPFPHASCGPTDNPYADVSDDAQLEVLIGRLPCHSRGQLRSMINKIFSYERTPFLSDTMWYRKATTVRQDPGPYHNAGASFVRSMLLDYGNYLEVDTLVKRKHNWRDLQDSINQGRSYVLYTGHGAGTHWVSPFNLPPSKKNDRALPVIFSWCCQTVLKRNYLGQRWLKTGTSRNPKGAVAFIGTTTSGLYAPYRNFVARNFFRAIFEHGVINIGKALKQGLDSLWTYMPDSFGKKLYSEWNLLGDPELNLWTQVPKPLKITCDTVVSFGQQSYTVNVASQDGFPISNALVCVMMPNDANVYCYGNTDHNGYVTFYINPVIADSIWVTVTARNYIPYEGRCRVVSLDTEFNVRHDEIFNFNQNKLPIPSKDIIKRKEIQNILSEEKPIK